MGRRKAGKPRRARGTAEYSLQQLQPPGYDEWITSAPGAGERAARDPQLTPEAVALTRRVSRLQPLYGPRIPLQALWLDLAIDEDVLHVRQRDGSIGRLPVGELARTLGCQQGEGEVRAAVHELHAGGALLVEPGDQETVLRVVVAKPAKPGDEWVFRGDPAASLEPMVCVPADLETLAPGELRALCYLRGHLAQGTAGSAEDFATFDGVGTVERAQELFDAVADLVEFRGCSACPAAQLCTRDSEAPA
jgi:hypothetical protein